MALLFQYFFHYFFSSTRKPQLLQFGVSVYFHSVDIIDLLSLLLRKTYLYLDETKTFQGDSVVTRYMKMLEVGAQDSVYLFCLEIVLTQSLC